jgi:hypothetical protein
MQQLACGAGVDIPGGLGPRPQAQDQDHHLPVRFHRYELIRICFLLLRRLLSSFFSFFLVFVCIDFPLSS